MWLLLVYVIKELIIFNKAFIWIAVSWLKSDLRRTLLKLRYTIAVGWQKKQPRAEVYLALNDPYSFMLVQVLPDLARRFNIEFRLFLVHDNVPGMAANIGLWRNWSLLDANRLAEQYKLMAIDKKPKPEALITGQQLWQIKPKNLANAADIFRKTWFDEFDVHYQYSTPVINHQIKNQARQMSRGHYLPATIYFLGDWFWGVDRLDHFERRLLELGLGRDKERPLYQKNQLRFCPVNSEQAKAKALEVFVSIRSPYSYLGFMQARQLSEHYGIPLAIKPVLPMLMQGLPMPEIKQRYIFFDALREAKTLGIPFNGFADPLGDGVVNAYQVFAYARAQGKAEAYMEKVFEAVYVNNLNLADRANLALLCRELELDYQQAIEYGEHYDWQAWVDLHQAEMAEMGFWGVPCFRYHGVECWGQDRLWQIEQEIIDRIKSD